MTFVLCKVVQNQPKFSVGHVKNSDVLAKVSRAKIAAKIQSWSKKSKNRRDQQILGKNLKFGFSTSPAMLVNGEHE